jgi:hypothetical protein
MLTKMVMRRLATIVLVAAIAVVVMLAGRVAADELHRGGRDVEYSPASPGITTPAARAQQMVARHGCWRAQPPPDMTNKVPGHVVVTTHSGRTRYGGARLVELALGQLFEGKKADLKIWGFCR